MLKRLIIFIFLLCSVTLLYAESRIVLRSSATIEGTIIFQNEEVIVIKDADGKRYQYPASEVLRVEEVKDTILETPKVVEKKVGIIIGVNGGILCDKSIDGTITANMMLGASNLFEKHIFLGGSIGYNALIIDKVNYSLLPIQLYTAIPISNTYSSMHAPFIGVGVGYGIALSKSYQGGLSAALDCGWRMQINLNSAFMLSARVDFQQLTAMWVDNTYSESFINKTTHTLCGVSLRTAILF